MKNIYRILTCSFLGVLLVACSNNKQPDIGVAPVEFRHHRVSQKLHTVQEGDTVGSIASTYGVTRAELIQKNNLSAPYELIPGQKLIVKTNDMRITNDKSSNSGGPNVSIVQEGGLETEYSLTKREMAESKSLPTKSTISSDSIPSVQLGNKKEMELVEADKVDVNDSDNELQPSYVWPVANGRKRISKSFDIQSGNILISTPGRTPVKAIADGIVKMAGKSGNEQLVRFGNMIVIQHKTLNKVSIYANVIDLKVKTGQSVSAGDIIASVGQTGIRGMTTEPVLYFEVDQTSKGKKRRPVDPCKILP